MFLSPPPRLKRARWPKADLVGREDVLLSYNRAKDAAWWLAFSVGTCVCGVDVANFKLPMSSDKFHPVLLLRLPMPTMGERWFIEEVERPGPSSSLIAMNVLWHPSMFCAVVAF